MFEKKHFGPQIALLAIVVLVAACGGRDANRFANHCSTHPDADPTYTDAYADPSFAVDRRRL